MTADASAPRAGGWTDVLTLNSDRTTRTGSAEALNAAIGRGADLRILTEFRHNEHIDTGSDSDELVREVCDFQVVHHIDSRWVAGIMSLRQPVTLPDRFGPRPSLSLFLYNQDGEQGIARPYLDGVCSAPEPGKTIPDRSDMPRYHQHDNWDESTNAPCHNFVYDFDLFRYFVRDEWHEVLAHDEHGRVRRGSVEALSDAFARGCQVKAALGGLCRDLDDRSDTPEHEVFVQAGSCYDYTRQRLFIAGTNPLVRVRPAIPLRYGSRNWDYGWCIARTDGHVAYRAVDPHSLAMRDRETRCAIRWFVR